MPTSETIELAKALRDELQLPIGKIVVNGVLPPLFSKAERAAIEGAGPVTGDTPADAAIAAGRSRVTRERVQQASLHRLSEELPISPSFLPQLFEDAAQPSAIRELAKRMG